MQPNISWLDDPRVFRVGQADAHSDHLYYETEAECAGGRMALCQTLDGVWKFAYSENTASRPADFWQEGYDLSAFGDIAVPGHIELAGYDKVHYINTMYPWEGKLYRRPALTGMPGARMEGQFSGADYNPVGSYVCRFDLEPALRGKRVSVRFEGVEQAMFVWLNGQFLGYAEDSFTPSEFDLTAAVRDTGNTLCVEVHKRSTAAYLEDQDFFRFFGIFRSVRLLARPAAHVEDLFVRPEVALETRAGVVRADVKLSGCAATVRARVLDGDRVLCETEAAAGDAVSLELAVPGEVTLWDTHNPRLYTLELRLLGEGGALLEIVPQPFGFRKIEIVDKVIRFNGKRLVINGVNRHEWNARTGRCITDADESWDIACMKRNFINAVRTCHYPDRLSWYRLCDEQGIMVMSETNLESHGSWQKAGGIEPSWNVPGSFEGWEAAVLDRARTHFETLKNHASILFWSLGNESYAGEVLVKMNRYFKQVDPSRLVHYEGVFNCPVYKDRISDVESHMYTPPTDVKAYLDNDPPKPFILCEYMHDMGNSLGGMKSYYDLVDAYPMMQGGFIWDYIDQAILVRDEVTGREVLRYGGDFDDRPADYEFSGNGIVFADRTEKPAIQEVRYHYGRHD
ncbi:MAG: glycoside hydrolase family 2 TIM barrel-domain containing protein [Candidatus Ventricola sp.]